MITGRKFCKGGKKMRKVLAGTALFALAGLYCFYDYREEIL